MRNSAKTGQRRSNRLVRQQGMTTLGMLFLITFVGLFVFAGLRLTPVYLNYFKVQGVVNGVLKEFDGQQPTRAAIRGSISRRFDVESVSEIRASDVKVTAVQNGFEVAASYKHEADFIGNLGFVVTFDKTVLIRR